MYQVQNMPVMIKLHDRFVTSNYCGEKSFKQGKTVYANALAITSIAECDACGSLVSLGKVFVGKEP